MSIDYAALPLSKGRSRRSLKAAGARAELKVQKAVRAACVERDGPCRFVYYSPWDDGAFADKKPFDVKPAHRCVGPSEWAHWGNKKRAKTRGMRPEERHTTTGSLMLCQGAHADYDQGRLFITALTRKGCDGRLKFRLKGDK